MAFSKRTKLAAALYQNVELEGMHADHIIPKSKGGSDDITNCQILDPMLNIEKSNKSVPPLREWQKEFIEKWDSWNEISFLLNAIPGAGKTIVALSVAQKWLRAAPDRCLVIIVPTCNLQTQWRDEAVPFGLKLHTKEFYGNIKDDYDGVVLTYQSLETMQPNLTYLCGRRYTLVILDEPHHCSDQASWGGFVSRAFEGAKRRLLLSGTPFRTDRRRIPFVGYDDLTGLCKVDFSYGYPEALRDEVIRHITFVGGEGNALLWTEEGEKNLEVNAAADPDQSARALRHILHPEGDWVRKQLTRAHDELLRVRRDIPDAAGMVVCIDQDYARRTAKVLAEITGKYPAIIVSDDSIATESVKDFRNSSSEWLVSVRQVSEGTDIKRLQVLAYMTNAITELFFRQLIGRVSRIRFDEKSAPNENALIQDKQAYVFLPEDPTLMSHAQNILIAQHYAINMDEDEIKEIREGGERQRSGSVLLETEHLGFPTVLVGGKQYPESAYGVIQQIRSDANITEESAAKIFDQIQAGRYTCASAPVAQQAETSHEEEMDKLRKKSNNLAVRRAYQKGDIELVKAIHARWKPQSQMNEKELRSKIETLAEELRSESN